jgi:hypothetical protein
MSKEDLRFFMTFLGHLSKFNIMRLTYDWDDWDEEDDDKIYKILSEIWDKLHCI